MIPIITDACQEGNIKFLEYVKKYVMNNTKKFKFTEQYFMIANLSAKKWFISSNMFIPSYNNLRDVFHQYCAESNSIDGLMWIINSNNFLPCDFNTGFYIACENNNYHGIKILYSQYHKNKDFNYYNKDVFEICCSKGFYIIIKWLLWIDNSRKIYIDESIILAICLNMDLYFAKDLSLLNNNLNKKEIYTKYINCIGYEPNLNKIKDRFDEKRIEIINWLKN